MYPLSLSFHPKLPYSPGAVHSSSRPYNNIGNNPASNFDPRDIVKRFQNDPAFQKMIQQYQQSNGTTGDIL